MQAVQVVRRKGSFPRSRALRLTAFMMGIQPKDEYLHVRGIRLHYLDWGNQGQPPMLLLHGFLGHAHVWDDLALTLRDRYHVIALDQRGHGQSQWLENGAYTLADHFSDIAGLVEALRLDPFILLGHSMGGRNALFYAACHPHKVARLILVDARPASNSQGSESLRHLLASFPRQASSFEEGVGILRSLYPFLSKKTCRHIFRHGFNRISPGRFVPRCDLRMIQELERSDGAIEDLWPFLESVACPTLIVRGQDSSFLSPEEAQAMCRRISGAELREIPKAGHLPGLENPRAFRKAVIQFLGKKELTTEDTEKN